MDGFLINLFSFFIIGITFFLFSYFRRRIQPVRFVEDDFQFIDRQLNNMNEHLRRVEPTNIQVKPIEIPFLVEIDALKSNSTDGVMCKLKKFTQNLNELNLILLWSLDINSFYSILEYPVRQLMDQNFQPNLCAKIQKISSAANDIELSFKVPDECKESFKDSNSGVLRNKYHLAIILFQDAEEIQSSQTVMANIFVYHLKDNRMETRCIHNYLKCSNNSIISLTMIKTNEENICVVCMTEQANQVILPCTHRCVCSGCLIRIPDKKCPMCRVQIINKFQIN